MRIIDCDVHPSDDDGAIAQYMPESLRKLPVGGDNMWPSPIGVLREDARTPSGGVAASDPAYTFDHWMDPYGVEKAVLLPGGALGMGIIANQYVAAGRTRATNDWLIDKWLNFSPRYLGALVVTPQFPDEAVKEIRRLGRHPQLVQIVMASATRIPLGQRCYWPIYEEALNHGLHISVHPGTEGKGVANGFIAGPPSTYLEWHTNIPQNYMGQITSLVCEGVFEHFPQLKFLAVEGGLAWIPGVLWRLDKNWKALRHMTPWLKKLPSEYIIEHVRFTSQPSEEPENHAHFMALMEMIHAEKTLMFSSDYPHWDNDSPAHGLPRLPQGLAERIYHKNAEELYGDKLGPKIEIPPAKYKPAISGAPLPGVTAAGAGAETRKNEAVLV
ncbi:MAG: amidohydrolase family protein [Candidatus Methylacidiphilales bacterium]|nr:amidohydrolase family protein [Candidatus Methylacidiphilales bacterium]